MKKQFFQLILFPTIFFMLTTSLWSSQIKYFKNYRINEWDFTVIGIDSLTETQALKTKCNKFIYDSTGTLTQIEGLALGLDFYDSQEEVIKIKFNYQGNSIFMFFLDNKNNPMTNKKENVFGKEIVKQKNGCQLYFLNEDGKRTTNRHNIHFISNKVDRINNIIEKQFYDANNNPIQNSERVFKIKNLYNQKRQLIETRYYNKNNKVKNNILNFAIIKYGYDNDGELVEKRYFDSNGNPAATFPFKKEDIPSFYYVNNPEEGYPGVDGQVKYAEGVYVGYRHYDARNINPLFPFGHGLTYTSFEYSDFEVNVDEKGSGTVSTVVHNAGEIKGKEVVQLYKVSPGRDYKELIGFNKTDFLPGQAKRITFSITPYILADYDKNLDYTVSGGRYDLLIGSSSRDIKFTKSFKVDETLVVEKHFK